MAFSQTTSAIMVFLSGLIPASCHKTPPPQQQKGPPPQVIQTTNAVDRSLRNLGEVLLADRAETTIHLSSGEDCVFAAKSADNQMFQITLRLETKNDFGDTSNFAMAQAVVQAGHPIEIAIGGLKLAFTPQSATAGLKSQ